MHNKTRWKSIYQTLNPVLHSANVFGLKSLKYQPTTSQTIFFFAEINDQMYTF